MSEQVLLLGRTQPLVGIISTPDRDGEVREPAVILLNAGIVHHVGPNRWSVRLARRLAEQGHLAVRFDHTGIGDSDPRRDSLPFEHSSVQEVCEVMDDLQRLRGIRSFLLLGLCSGATTAVLSARADQRVAAAVLVNPPGGGGDERVDRHLLNKGWAGRYWSISLLDPGAWWRALSGRIQYRRLLRVLWTQLMDRVRPPAQLDRQFHEIASLLADVAGRGTQILFVFTANDQGRSSVLKVLANPLLERFAAEQLISHTTISGSDHTFALRCNQDQLLATVGRWIETPGGMRAHGASKEREIAAST